MEYLKSYINQRRPVQIKLGREYIISFKYGNWVRGKFIRPTKCGYNFLNEATNRCVFKNHLYPSKCENHFSEDWFFINTQIVITMIK